MIWFPNLPRADLIARSPGISSVLCTAKPPMPRIVPGTSKQSIFYEKTSGSNLPASLTLCQVLPLSLGSLFWKWGQELRHQTEQVRPNEEAVMALSSMHGGEMSFSPCISLAAPGPGALRGPLCPWACICLHACSFMCARVHMRGRVCACVRMRSHMRVNECVCARADT